MRRMTRRRFPDGMLFLFDIDGTLVDTGGAGMQALEEATLEVFRCAGPPLDLAGATDLGLVHHLHAHFGLEATLERVERYLEVYHGRLDWNLAHGGFPGRVFDGVPGLLERLGGWPGGTLALLTGNTARGAAAKMRHFRLDHHFGFGAFGSDHADRNRLGPIALERARRHSGREHRVEETWVIGDTPKDIACARAMGARCLAVATGRFTMTELEAHGADRVVASLEDLEGFPI